MYDSCGISSTKLCRHLTECYPFCYPFHKNDFWFDFCLKIFNDSSMSQVFLLSSFFHITMFYIRSRSNLAQQFLVLPPLWSQNLFTLSGLTNPVDSDTWELAVLLEEKHVRHGTPLPVTDSGGLPPCLPRVKYKACCELAVFSFHPPTIPSLSNFIRPSTKSSPSHVVSYPFIPNLDPTK